MGHYLNLNHEGELLLHEMLRNIWPLSVKSLALPQVIASHLLVGPLREEDGGVYRCRVDFREAPTRNTRIKLNLISKFNDLFSRPRQGGA